LAQIGDHSKVKENERVKELKDKAIENKNMKLVKAHEIVSQRTVSEFKLKK
jgi:hypothetical protein